MTLTTDYRAIAAEKDPAAKAYFEDPRHLYTVYEDPRHLSTVTDLDRDSARLQERMEWVQKTLTDRANDAANGVVFSDPVVDPENLPRTLEDWIAMSQPTGEVCVVHE